MKAYKIGTWILYANEIHQIQKFDGVQYYIGFGEWVSHKEIKRLTQKQLERRIKSLEKDLMTLKEIKLD